MKRIVADIDEILHEWHTPKAERILQEMGVSERNWRLPERPFRSVCVSAVEGEELADMEGNISHVRVWQIVKKTRQRLREYMESRRAK